MSQGSYRRSLGRSSHSMVDGSRSKGLLHTSLTLALAIALVVALVVNAPNASFRNDYRSLTIERMQKEIDTAVQYSRYLSRTASSNSNAQLAVVRSSIYSVQVLNETFAALSGGGNYLLDPTLTANVISTLESYYNRLTTGNNTSDNQTELSNQLDILQQAAIQIK